MKMWAILFFLLPLVGIAYIGWHIWTLLPLHWAWKSLVILCGTGCFGSLFFIVNKNLDTLPLALSQMLYEIGTSSIFIMLYLVLTFLLLDLGRLVHLVPRSWLYGNWWSVAGIFVTIFAVFLYGNLHYKHKVRVPLTLTTTKPLAKDYRIVMLSDLHLGYHNPRTELARWVDMVNAEQPDLILIAGDIIDGSIRPLIEEDMAAEFHRLHAPVYACLGNHEYYSGCPEAQRFFRQAGIHLLSDSSAVIDSTLVIIGRDDRTNLHRKSVKELATEAHAQLATDTSLPSTPSPTPPAEKVFTILLDHQPYNLELAEQSHIDFQLSGHTHRGQVWPISWITDAIYECSWGNHQRGNTHYYISSGIGIWGGKFRIGTQSEYVVATLNSKP